MQLAMVQVQDRVSDRDGNTPVVGMGLTVRIGSDSYAYTIVSVSASGKSFKATQDSVSRTDSNGPYTEDQHYDYTPNPQGELISFRIGTKTQRYQCKFGYAHLGYRRYYNDPCF